MFFGGLHNLRCLILQSSTPTCHNILRVIDLNSELIRNISHHHNQVIGEKLYQHDLTTASWLGGGGGGGGGNLLP